MILGNTNAGMDTLDLARFGSGGIIGVTKIIVFPLVLGAIATAFWSFGFSIVWAIKMLGAAYQEWRQRQA